MESKDRNSNAGHLDGERHDAIDNKGGINYTPRCLHHGPAWIALTREGSDMEKAIFSKLARKEEMDRGEETER
jgi:hypothetical protein